MSKLVMGAFFIVMLLFFTVFTTSFQYLIVADSDNETSAENATRNAMTQSINWGNARVNEEITINQDIAVEAVLRQYADSSDFFDGDRFVNIYRTSSNPPMIAVESYSTIGTPFQNMANSFNKENNSSKTVTRSREIVIYEAKELTK